PVQNAVAKEEYAIPGQLRSKYRGVSQLVNILY
ncbi:unnamed protein product, partial [marine sediment metagenome]